MRVGLVVVLAAVAALVFGVLPTCLYLYVEPRGRSLWGKGGDQPSTRRAPFLVRLTAWQSFLLGEVAFVWPVVTAICGVLLYLQARLGLFRPLDLASTAAVGVIAGLQALLALRLIPLGVRLLMCDSVACARAGARARFYIASNGWMLALAGGLTWAIHNVPGFVHPWLAAALSWAALRPVMIFGGACLLHTLLVAKCADAVRESNSASKEALGPNSR